MMKKIILAAVVAGFASSSFAAAATACTAGTATAVPAGAATDFVKVGFTPKCSSNTNASYDQNSTTFAVTAGSAKGKNYFSGNTNGGGVTVDSACPATGCTLTDTATKATTKLSASS